MMAKQALVQEIEKKIGFLVGDLRQFQKQVCNIAANQTVINMANVLVFLDDLHNQLTDARNELGEEGDYIEAN